MIFRYKKLSTIKPEPIKYNIITLGYDCSPAQAFRDMGRRTEALPFDWIISSVASFEKCFQDDFSMFHKNLTFNDNKTRLIDHYGFEFPHDYPTINQHIIVEKWPDYHNEVCQKYRRRIDRFLNILRDPTPLIILCRHDINDLPKIKSLFKKYYDKENLFFVNSTPQKQTFFRPAFDPEIFNYTTLCHTEKNGDWNETAIWTEALDWTIKQYITK
jgi:hypothetical protein